MPSGRADGQNRDDGWNCASGQTPAPVFHPLDRLLQPRIRTDRRSDFEPVSWNTAIANAAARFRAIVEKHGPDSVAFCGGGLDTEAAYLAVKLFKGTIGTNNTDATTRLSSGLPGAGYRTSLGADGPPPCLADIDHADCITVWGCDIADADPATFDRIKARKKANPSLDWIVIDPCKSVAAAHADLHVPVAPGGEIALMNAVARRLIDIDAIDHRFIAAHTTGFDDFFHQVTSEDYADLVDASGVPDALIRDLARRLGSASAWLNFTGLELDASGFGIWKQNSVINLHLLTGQIGKVGAGPFSIPESSNGLGAREAGLSAHQLPGYRLVDDPSHRHEVEACWNRPEGTIPRSPGLTLPDMFQALETGGLKAIWIAVSDSTDRLLDQPHVRRALARAELVIVQGGHGTDACDVFFPTTHRDETEGTRTSGDRLVTLRKPLQSAAGASLPDWQIISRFAQVLGYSGFDFTHANEVWDEFIRLTSGRPCDMSGLSSSRLASDGPLHWPCPTPEHPGTERLYLDRKFPTPDGLARFLLRAHRGPYEAPDHEFSIIHSNGRRTSAQPATRVASPRGQRADQGRTRILRNATGP